MTLTDLQKRFDDLNVLVEKLFNNTAHVIDIENRRLKDALKEQIGLQLDWESATNKANYLYDMAELEVDSAYSGAIEAELKNGYKSTSISEAREFAKANKDYQNFRRVAIEIKELRDECRGILDTVQSRKYILNNLTNAIVAASETHII